jgi:hypothetical protein
MKFYLAAKFERRSELQSYKNKLEELGHSVPARWLDPQYDERNVAEGPGWESQVAGEDLDDIMDCDQFVAFNPSSVRGGMNVEIGFALGRIHFSYLRSKRFEIHIIGGASNVFTFLPYIIHHESFEAFLKKLTQNSHHWRRL